VNGALELRLRALGQQLELPPEPDLAPAVLEQLSLSGKRPFPWRRTAVLAFALLALAVGAAFAVPQARTAILRFFHLGGATVVRVETLPPAVERPKAGGLGRSLSLDDAQRAVGFRLALPPFKGDGPTRVYVLDDSVATVIIRAYPPFHPLLLSEFRSLGPSSLKKLVFGETMIESVHVDGHAGFWLEGGTHTLQYFDRRLGFREQRVLIHGNVLLWVRGGLTLRLEGKLTKDQAIALARRVR
jgi:hypothetical protein